MDIYISNLLGSVLRPIGSYLLILYGGYNIANGWSSPSHGLFTFDIRSLQWSWISGNSTGSVVDPYKNGYVNVTTGVSSKVSHPPALMQHSALSFDNRFYIFGGVRNDGGKSVVYGYELR
jgi:hypothetical protein